MLGIGRDEWVGVGLGNSLQTNLYIPEQQSDFILAVIVEELGCM